MAAADPSRKIRYEETGFKFRKLITGATLTSKLSKEIYDRSGIFPAFLAVWTWVTDFVEDLTGEEHIIFDGSPRLFLEAQVLESALLFYKMKPFVIYLDIHNDVSHTRLTARGRLDDVTPERIQNRLDWYEKEVVPTIEYYKQNPHFKFLHINGDQTISEVYKEIIDRIAPLM